MYFVTKGLCDVLTAPAVSQGDGDCTFSALLTNNKLVEFRDDFAWGHV
jgi:hypothetical protein